ncbi:substrate-binding periplasmic protein [Marinobacter sp.]|uniref:substrate-binding periplasmic protein n=1 Tax=Marinobacter sp. TaxID=50741 RepID=UPI0035C76507
MKTMVLCRSKATAVNRRSRFRDWLPVCLCAGISCFATATSADPGGAVVEQDHQVASIHYPSTEGGEERAVGGSSLRPTIHLTAPEDAFVQDVSIRVLRKAYDRLGYELVVHKLPNLRSLISANNGTYDGEVSRVANLGSIYPNLHTVPTAINAVNVVAVGQQGTAEIRKVEDIRDDPLCVRGVVIVEHLVNAHRIKCMFVVNINQALAMVSLGRAKYTLLPDINARISVLHSPFTNVEVVSPVLHSEALYHYLHKKNLRLVEPLDKVLSEMRSTGEIDEIRSDYFNSIPGRRGTGLEDNDRF